MREILPLGLIVGGGVLIALFLPAFILVSLASVACYGTPFGRSGLALLAFYCQVPSPIPYLVFTGFGVAFATAGAFLLRRG